MRSGDDTYSDRLARRRRKNWLHIGCLAVVAAGFLSAAVWNNVAEGQAEGRPAAAASQEPAATHSGAHTVRLFETILDHVPPGVWTTPWVVHAQPAGNGERVLDYLARYLFRVAITNSRLEHVDDQRVIFRYRDNRTQEMRRATLSGVDFLQRFLQHVLPPRFTKVRYFGLCSRVSRDDLDQARQLLEAISVVGRPATSPAAPTPLPASPSCPLCHAGTLTVIAVLPRQLHLPP